MNKFRYETSHYEWLEKNLETIFDNLSLDYSHHCGIIRYHGDKAYSYRDMWKKEGIHFFHGMAMYLLSYVLPFSNECRQTKQGWVPVETWVIDKYKQFKKHFPPTNFMEITSTKIFTPKTSNHPICHICNNYTAKWLLVIDDIYNVAVCDNCRTVDVDEIMDKML